MTPFDDDLDIIGKALDRMDRSGGDRDGMPECPWCHRDGTGEDHELDCELLAARQAVWRLRRASGERGRR